MAEHMQRAEDFSKRLASQYGDDLVSVGLYGSAARGEYREGASDLNLLVILREVDAERLRSGSALAAEWVEAGNPPPLIFSEEEWIGSADVFPIEYSDIADAHVVLHGSDPFGEVEVRWEHLRHMCEHEIKARKLALRERYLLASGSPDEMGRLLLGSISTFVAIFRAMLRLSGSRPPAQAAEVVTVIAERAGFEPGPFHRVLEARRGTASFRPEVGDEVVVGYLAGVTRAAEWLDRLGPPSGAGEPAR
jgi:hypothetical protein